MKKFIVKYFNSQSKTVKGLIIFGLLFFFAFTLGVTFYLVIDRVTYTEEVESQPPVPEIDSVPPQKIIYGIAADSFEVIELTVKQNQNFSSIVSGYNITGTMVQMITDSFRTVFDFRKIRTGCKYLLLVHKKQPDRLRYMVYEPDPITYIITDFDSMIMYSRVKNVDTVVKSISGVIETSLWVDMIESGAPPELITTMSDIFAWQIDFFSINRGDCFKIIYEEILIDSTVIGIGKVKSAMFRNSDENFYAIYFKSGSYEDYYDERGNCLRKMFLKAPLKFSRISSRFTHSRYHPVLKIYRPHLAIDYVASKGTPVQAIGDGIVVSAGYSGGAGNMVKIRHNTVYTTGYNHLSRFGKGIRKGQRVRQGQIIGYVGSTGLSTGPHLDFRVWKNGVNVNPLSLKMPPARSVEQQYLNQFNPIRNKALYDLNRIALPK